ncbi:MAG: threonylcarbamoyl-AMP synthase [Clostridiales bacterium]|nr:threonylcarbamoyl-AMP synthase [Clostridiales bacterium]
METKIFKIQSSDDTQAIAEVAEILKNGGIAAIPTETVYGLAAGAFDVKAVENIFIAKGRPQDNPLIVHIADFDSINELVSSLPDSARILAKKFWPGPLTMILPKSDKVPLVVTAGLDTVAVRMPSHPVAAAIIRASGLPLAAPSANLSGKPSPTNARYVIEDLNGRVDAIADGGDCSAGVESTVISLAGDVPRVLRPGVITVEQLRSVLGDVIVDKAVLSQPEKGAKVMSPGMKYKHYAPKAKITIINSSLERYIEYINENATENTAALCFDGEERLMPLKCVTYGGENDGMAQAHRLFDALRELDEIGAQTVFARCPSSDGVGLAVYNRLLRAAAFRVVYLFDE